MKSSAGTVFGGLLIGGGLYWAWRKMQLGVSLQISLDTFVPPNQIKIRFRNAAAAGVTINAIFLNLYLNNVLIGEINSDNPFYIEGRSQTSQTLKLIINMGTLLQTAGALVPVIMSVIGGGPIPKNLTVKGWISAAGNQMQVNQPLSGVPDLGGRGFGEFRFGQYAPQHTDLVRI